MTLANEDLFPGPVAVEKVIGDRPHYSTFFRWTQHGIRTPNGGRVRLEFLKAGSKRLTSVEAVRRFFAASTAATTEPQYSIEENPGQQSEQDCLASQLDREGL